MVTEFSVFVKGPQLVKSVYSLFVFEDKNLQALDYVCKMFYFNQWPNLN